MLRDVVSIADEEQDLNYTDEQPANQDPTTFSDWQGFDDPHGFCVRVENHMGTGHLLVTRAKPLPAYGFLQVCSRARLLR